MSAISHESYAHSFAKELLTRWLRDAAGRAGYQNGVNFGAIGWRVNRPGPSWGVWTEYPVCVGQNTVWDEIDDCWTERPPRLDELPNVPRCIIDIAVQHKGSIIYAIEILHKHPLDDEKICFLRDFVDCDIYQIPTRWVLGQIGPPQNGVPHDFRL